MARPWKTARVSSCCLGSLGTVVRDLLLWGEGWVLWEPLLSRGSSFLCPSPPFSVCVSTSLSLCVWCEYRYMCVSTRAHIRAVACEGRRLMSDHLWSLFTCSLWQGLSNMQLMAMATLTNLFALETYCLCLLMLDHDELPHPYSIHWILGTPALVFMI